MKRRETKQKRRMVIKTRYGHGDGYQQRRIKKTIIKSLAEHPRTALIRIDLRFPTNLADYKCDTEVITRFFKSLKEKFPVYLKHRAERGVRVHPSNLRYFWVREFNKKEGVHYHIVLLVNWDTVCYVNAVNVDGGSFYTTVADAWLSATGINNARYRYLTHIPKNCVYGVSKKDLDENGIEAVYEPLKHRLDYLIKLKQKKLGTGKRNFGRSQ